MFSIDPGNQVRKKYDESDKTDNEQKHIKIRPIGNTPLVPCYPSSDKEETGQDNEQSPEKITVFTVIVCFFISRYRKGRHARMERT